MTNATIIYNAACELMKQGVIKATGRLLMKKLPDGSLIEVPEPETIHTYNGWKALGYQVRKGEAPTTASGGSFVGAEVSRNRAAAAGSERSVSPVGCLPKAEATRRSQPKQVQAPLQGDCTPIEAAFTPLQQLRLRNEHAVAAFPIWKYSGKQNEETGEETDGHCFQKVSHFFTASQVEKVS